MYRVCGERDRHERQVPDRADVTLVQVPAVFSHERAPAIDDEVVSLPAECSGGVHGRMQDRLPDICLRLVVPSVRGCRAAAQDVVLVGQRDVLQLGQVAQHLLSSPRGLSSEEIL